MRLYKIIASYTPVTELPSETVWAGSKADGVAKRKALMEKGFRRKDIEEVEVDVPTNKEGLLAFLNNGGAEE